MNFFITGASSGLGHYISSNLSSNSDHFVYGTYNSTIPEEDTAVNFFKINFEDKKDVKNLLSLISTQKFDVLINNFHPGYSMKHLHKVKSDEMISCFKSYICPTVDITNDFIKKFRSQKSGIIINILSSVTLSNPPIGQSIYVAEKKFLESLNLSWHIENYKLGINSVAISPSIMDTNIHRKVDSHIKNLMLSSTRKSDMNNILNLIKKIIFDPKKYSGKNFEI